MSAWGITSVFTVPPAAVIFYRFETISHAVRRRIRALGSSSRSTHICPSFKSLRPEIEITPGLGRGGDSLLFACPHKPAAQARFTRQVEEAVLVGVVALAVTIGLVDGPAEDIRVKFRGCEQGKPS